jgi:hypothetical protein
MFVIGLKMCMFGDKVDFWQMSMLECLFIRCALFEGKKASCLITLDFFSMMPRPSLVTYAF